MVRYSITLASIGITVTVLGDSNLLHAVAVAEESVTIFNYMSGIFGETIKHEKIQLKPYEYN